MPKPRENRRKRGSEKMTHGLHKITTYIPYGDYETIKEFSSDGSKDAEHYRAAIRMYIRQELKKRKNLEEK